MSIRATVAVPGTVGILPMVPAPSSDAWIVVYNATWYPLWIQFGPPVPVKPAAIGNEPDWAYQIGAGDVQKMPAPAGWDGSIYLSPFLPNGALASGLTQYATVSTYPRGQDPEIASSMPVTLLPQQRVVTVPVVPHIPILWKAQDISAAFTNATIIAATSAGVTYTAYLYGASLEIRGVRFWRGSFFLAYYSSTPAFLGDGPELYTVELYAGVPWPIPSGIIAATATTPASTASLRLRAEPAEQYPASVPALLTATFLLDIDLSGQPPPPAIGNGAGTVPGVVY